MHIAFLSYWSCPFTPLGILRSGGMNVYVNSLTNHLAELGHRIDIYVREHEEHHSRTITHHKNVRIQHIQGKGVPYSVDDQHKFTRLCKEELSHHTYDLIHAHYYTSGLIGLALKKDCALPLVQTFHTLAVMKRQYGGIQDKNREEKEKVIVQGIDAIIASTDLEKAELIQYYGAQPGSIHVISPGIDHTRFRPYKKEEARAKLHLPQDKHIILFVGRIDPIKGLTTLIEAVSSLQIQYPSFEKEFLVLLIGGDKKSRAFWESMEVQRIQHMLTEKNLSCCVKFLGAKSPEELPYYYAAANIVAMPSVYESFGLVVLEAMASGAAIVASRVGGLQYLITDGVNGRLFQSGDSRDCARVLWEVLNNLEEQHRLGQHALQSSQSFCWQFQAEKVAALYKSLL